MEPSLAQGIGVRHALHGMGTVRADLGSTVVVRFDHGVEECQKADLSTLPSFVDRLQQPQWDMPLEVINRIQAECITSVNDAWGVFARSRIDLLPHQLWVCREVTREWPARWLVADDVGLGKTIEAGIILTALLSRGRINRLLVICPASLVEQWQQRLRTMFDIRLAIYTPAADTPRTDFWHTHFQVVVSMHTLRGDHRGRHERLLEAEPWNLVLVDESHHLNADEKAGPTLAYQLVKKLDDHGKVRSMVFFTGTPHRGKTFGFLAQLHLLRPDLFDPRQPLAPQLPNLRQVVIRNNKYNVTDLKGRRLFEEPVVKMATYGYSDKEQLFYDTLTEFIVAGRAYAARLSQTDASAVMLVLITMQKLASSSVAAVRRTIRGRLQKIAQGRQRLADLKKRIADYEQLLEGDPNDAIAAAEEEIMEISSGLNLTDDEEPTLRRLLDLAAIIGGETKIGRLLRVLEDDFQGRSVLFFTEYKATQSLLMSALIERYGPESVTFINGDDRADEVQMPDGTSRSIRTSRDDAQDRFNTGRVRFLVSTEAAAEGIDLQESCHTLVHVDLPWNPMRLHQRVGRLLRYGQREQVEVLSIRNPDTVESRIWRKLDEKLDRINEAFAHVMDSPEDLKQLVLGMASSHFYQSLFADAVVTSRERLSNWFDERTASMGGEDVVEVVEALVGSVHRFDFQSVSSRMPGVDLPDLQMFFEGALALNGRRVAINESGITFNTPDAWRRSPAIRTKYTDMVFQRGDHSPESGQRLLGIGHKIFHEALEQAKAREVHVATLPSSLLSEAVMVFRVQDKVTDGDTTPGVIYGLSIALTGGEPSILKDWEVLLRLNRISWRKEIMRQASAPGRLEAVLDAIGHAERILQGQLDQLVPRFRVAESDLLAVLWPT